MTSNIELIEDKEKGLIHRRFCGTVTFHEIYTSWEFIIEEYLKKRLYKGIINDLCDGKLQIDLEQLKMLLELFKSHEAIFKKLKIAVVADSPDSIVLPIFAANHYPEIDIRAFSTNEAALLWMDS